MDKTCKNCKWWDNGTCDAPQSNAIRTRVSMWEGSSFSVSDSNSFGIYADADDDSGLCAHLVTGPDFGCVKFIQK